MSNALENSGSVIEDLVVLEAQDREPGCGEPKVARAITERRRKVRGAICFDDEPRLLAEKIDDEGAERLLSAKLRALELAPA